MRKLSTRTAVSLGVALATIVTACWFLYRAYNEVYSVPLDPKLIANFKVQQTLGDSHMTLKVSGQPMYSGMVVRNVTTKAHGSVLFVTPHLALVGLAKPMKQGEFEYQLLVPDSVDEVRFGEPETSVWRRHKNR